MEDMKIYEQKMDEVIKELKSFVNLKEFSITHAWSLGIDEIIGNPKFQKYRNNIIKNIRIEDSFIKYDHTSRKNKLITPAGENYSCKLDVEDVIVITNCAFYIIKKVPKSILEEHNMVIKFEVVKDLSVPIITKISEISNLNGIQILMVYGEGFSAIVHRIEGITTMWYCQYVIKHDEDQYIQKCDVIAHHTSVFYNTVGVSK